MQNLNLTLYQLEASVLVDKDGPETQLFLGPLRNKELKQALQRALAESVFAVAMRQAAERGRLEIDGQDLERLIGRIGL